MSDYGTVFAERSRLMPGAPRRGHERRQRSSPASPRWPGSTWAGTEPLTPEMRLVEDLRLDSIRLLTLAMEVENRFRVRLDELDEGAIETVGDLVAIVRRKLGWLIPWTRTINDWLAAAGRRPEGGLRFVDRSEAATWFGWGEVRERALAVCGGLREPRVRRGDRVALIFPTGIEFFDGLLRRPPRRRRAGAALSAGAARPDGRVPPPHGAHAGALRLPPGARRLRGCGASWARRSPRRGPTSAAGRSATCRRSAGSGDGAGRRRARRPRPDPVLLRHHGRSQAGRPEPPGDRRPGRDPQRLLARYRRSCATAASPGCRSTTTWG